MTKQSLILALNDPHDNQTEFKRKRKAKKINGKKFSGWNFNLDSIDSTVNTYATAFATKH